MSDLMFDVVIGSANAPYSAIFSAPCNTAAFGQRCGGTQALPNLSERVRVLRGATLKARGEKERDLQEFRASRHTYVCSPTESAFSYDDADIDHAIEKLGNESGVSRAVRN